MWSALAGLGSGLLRLLSRVAMPLLSYWAGRQAEEGEQAKRNAEMKHEQLKDAARPNRDRGSILDRMRDSDL